MKITFRLTRSFVLFLLIAISTFANGQVINVKFKPFSEADSSASKTLRSLVRVRNISEQYATGGLYLMTFKGDFDKLFQNENQRAINSPMITQPWRFCSVFSTKKDDSVIMGRNWDNQNVGSIIVSLYKPAKGYASVSFARAIDMGFPLNVDLKEMTSGPFAKRLLLTPFFADDGMNEHGLCVVVTGINHVSVEPQKGKQLMFITYFLRKILNQTKTVDEAVDLAEKYIPFDLNKNSLDCHFYIADSTGRSVILEYRNNKWERTYSHSSWQVMTNKPIFGKTNATLEKECWRYKSISETLGKTNGEVGWKAGMQILRNVSQKGTTWSVIYSPTSKDLYFSVYQDWSKIYHIQPFK